MEIISHLFRHEDDYSVNINCDNDDNSLDSLFAPANAAAKENVSITQGSALKTTNAFSPNPVHINVGDMVTWVNDDSQAHTITSGTGPNDINKGNEFDSCANLSPILTPGKTFIHTFTQPGVFEYFS